eukprot:7880041-Alexandrium_andersonii.AAC.1
MQHRIRCLRRRRRPLASRLRLSSMTCRPWVSGPTQTQRVMFLLLVLSRAAGLLVETRTCSQLWIPQVGAEGRAKLSRLP